MINDEEELPELNQCITKDILTQFDYSTNNVSDQV